MLEFFFEEALCDLLLHSDHFGKFYPSKVTAIKCGEELADRTQKGRGLRKGMLG